MSRRGWGSGGRDRRRSSTALGAGHAVGPDGRGVGLEGVERVEDGREVFVLDVDEADGVFGGGLGLGDDGGDGLAAESGLALRQHLAGPGGGRDLEDGGEVVGGDDGEDAGLLEGLGGVDPLDPGVGVLPEDEPDVEQAVEGRSSPKRAWPVTFSGPSTRGMRAPRYVVGAASVTAMGASLPSLVRLAR